MFCTKCGRQLDNDARFCPGCGSAVAGGGYNPNQNTGYNPNQNTGYNPNQNTGYNPNRNTGYNPNRNANYDQAYYGNGEKGWKSYFTPRNIERFGPIATVLPLAMGIVVGIIGAILRGIFGLIGVGFIASVIVFLLDTIFCVTAFAAAIGLIYVAVKFKNTSNPWVWAAPGAAMCAAVACLCSAFSWNVVAWIFGLVSVLMGVELIARISLAGHGMETPMNPSAAFRTYGDFYRDYKAKHPKPETNVSPAATAVVPVSSNNGYMNGENSCFDGSGAELLGYSLLAALVTVLTCGIATPWMLCKIYKWRIGHTVVNGKRLTFTGTGASLIGHWILWELLTIVTCGIYGYFSYVALCKWEASHTFIEGEPIIPQQNTSFFDGNSFEYLGYGILGGLLFTVTCGIAYPWVLCMLQKWETGHQVVNGHRMRFSGTGAGFLGEYIIIALLSLVTCGIYGPWGTVRMNRYVIGHTDFEN